MFGDMKVKETGKRKLDEKNSTSALGWYGLKVKVGAHTHTEHDYEPFV